MKKVLFFLAVLSLVVISSCGGDDDDATPAEVGLSGTVTFDGQSYSIANGIFNQTDDDGNARGIFFLSDGTLTATANGATASGATIFISVDAIATNSSALTNGAYETSTNVPELFAYVNVTLIDGANSTDRGQPFVGGIVNISGSGNTYTLTFSDLNFGQGVSLSGSVSGTYSNE